MTSDAQGLVYVFTGHGKGKTSAALGTALRAVGGGMKVAWVAWYKQESWGISEVASLETLGVDVYMEGKGFYLKSQSAKVKVQNDKSKVKIASVGSGEQKVIDAESEANHKMAANEALLKVQELVTSGEYDLVVLDEVNNAVHDGLLDIDDVIELISLRKSVHMVLTGRDVHDKVVEVADLVTECKKMKHPYDEGKLAVKGLDF